MGRIPTWLTATSHWRCREQEALSQAAMPRGDAPKANVLERRDKFHCVQIIIERWADAHRKEFVAIGQLLPGTGV